MIATFQLDMSKYQDEIIDPNSVGVIGYPPLLSRQKHLPMTWDSTRGIYTLSLKIPDSLIGKPLAYSYVVDSTIRDSPGYSWREIYLPKKSKTIPVDFFNEFVGSTGENIKPSPPIKVVRANTPAEELSLSEEFIGITSDGSAVENLYSIKKTGVETKSIVEAVSQYIEELTADQKKISLFPVDSDEWRKWHNIEFYERQGLGIFEMNEKQKELAFNILKTSLSARGFEKSKNIMAMEGYLKRLVIEQRQIPQRRIDLLGDDKFYFTIMGRPSESEPWGWQLDGHHLVINYFVLGDQVVMTPVFMGSEPNYIEDGPNSGIKTFEEEEEKGLALYRSLKGEQRERATLWSKKEYQFNQAEAFNDNQVIPFKGLRCTDLTTEQTDLLKSLIQEYIGNMKPGHAKIKMAEIEQHMDNTWFSWVGGSSENDVFYYRIHSPVILIEFDHHSPVFLWDRDKLHPGPVHWHIHTVVRTPNGNDYGKDLLKQHLQNHPH
ncbi:MAG: DUF3500 domain-containing protein [Fulvivirga sp.]|nr:DUF3500 domain-containing protein [Fulvivirga sp.]